MGSQSISDDERRLRKEIGAAIHRVRRSRKVSQGEIAKHLNVVLNTVRKYEDGITAVPSTVLVRIAEKLECSPLELLAIVKPEEAEGVGSDGRA
jgi:transcriptional regulator with XRE-family HTH domain